MCVTVLLVSVSTHLASYFCKQKPSVKKRTKVPNAMRLLCLLLSALQWRQLRGSYVTMLLKTKDKHLKFDEKTAEQRFAVVQVLVHLLTAVAQAAQPATCGLLPSGPSTESPDCAQLLGPAGVSLGALAPPSMPHLVDLTPPSVPHLACPSLVLSSQLLVSERYAHPFIKHRDNTHDTRLMHTCTTVVTHNTGNPGTGNPSTGNPGNGNSGTSV